MDTMQDCWLKIDEDTPKDGTIIQITDGNSVEAAYWGLHPKSVGGDCSFPWVILDSTNGTNGMRDADIIAWQPLSKPPINPET